MPQRTIGWVQNPGLLSNLRLMALCLCCGTKEQEWLIHDRFPLLVRNSFMSQELCSEFIMMLQKEHYHFAALVGKGAGGQSRSLALCTGIVQAIINGQKRRVVINNSGVEEEIYKPYTDDWSAKGFVSWGIVTGFLHYDSGTDTCRPTEAARALRNQELTGEVMQEALLSYPPVTRVLDILNGGMAYTKFEIGSQLGFIGEEGFTTIPLERYAAIVSESPRPAEAKRNTEGDSDKYARSMLSWLEQLGWVQCGSKIITASYLGREYTLREKAYTITLQGQQALLKSRGNSSNKRIAKRVLFHMLASNKTASANYLRKRRALLLDALIKGDKSLQQLQRRYDDERVEANFATILDDIRGLINIGLNIVRKGNDKYALKDAIIELSVPENITYQVDDVTEIKNFLAANLKYINHHYLILVDLAYSSKGRTQKAADARQFEIETANLLTKELNFSGLRLGDSARPDVIAAYGKQGIIIDNKSYQEGFSLDKGCADEMNRYIMENAQRKPHLPPNEWWRHFAKEVTEFYFMFITSYLKGNFAHNLQEISKLNNGIKGSVIGVQSLLYLADRLKGKQMEYAEFFKLINNNEITVPPIT